MKTTAKWHCWYRLCGLKGLSCFFTIAETLSQFKSTFKLRTIVQF